MRFVIAGSSGFLGTALRARLAQDGHEITRLVRRQPTDSNSSRWDPAAGQVDDAVIAASDVVVTLAGAPIIRPWTRSVRRGIRDSRVAATTTLAQSIARSPRPPTFLVQSGTDYYGNSRGAMVLDETVAGVDSGLLHRVAVEVEAAAQQAAGAGARVCLLRTGAVIDKRGSSLRAMLPVFRLGLGGRVSSGRQYFPIISLRDWVSAVIHLATSPSSAGPFNLCAPEPPTNAEFTEALGRALHRPTKLIAPAFVLEKAMGELSGLLLGSVRTVPRRLQEHGFGFQDPTIDEILAQALR